MTASEMLRCYRLSNDVHVYLVGAFDNHVTVLSQQIRALNLVWALVQAQAIPVDGANAKVGIVGAGFSGLTIAAALLRKVPSLEVYLFEEHDTLLPLQQGSDTRWLHPHIYEWPDEGSESSAAMLPVLNWTAARASDVVVQVLDEWTRVVEDAQDAAASIKVFCNARHLQVEACPFDSRKVQIEWTGEERKPTTGTSLKPAAGRSETFDIVFLAVGFGLERDSPNPYWRNETFGQPSLRQPHTAFVVSGQGDGAMIDLQRLRISQYRQDRILDELFFGRDALMGEVRDLKRAWSRGTETTTLFRSFETLGRSDSAKLEKLALVSDLRDRLRRDTEAVLRIKVRNLDELFKAKTSRISFQNALLVYLLYECGAFAPVRHVGREGDFLRRLGVEKGNVIRRHGTDRMAQFRRLLSDPLYNLVQSHAQGPVDDCRLVQPIEIAWPGGFFGYPGRQEDLPTLPEEIRDAWRKEYIPGPTILLSSMICGGVAGFLKSVRPSQQFRATLHRTVKIRGEELLQQACEYFASEGPASQDTVGRTMDADALTIGLAFDSHSIVRSCRDVDPEDLRAVMGELKLDRVARKMRGGVHFLLAIPLLQPLDDYFEPSRVSGVFYCDSVCPDFWLPDDVIRAICGVLANSLSGLEAMTRRPLDRLRNVATGRRSSVPITLAWPADKVGNVLERVQDVEAPVAKKAFHFNFEHTDLTPARH